MPLLSSGDSRFLSQKLGKMKTILSSNSRSDSNNNFAESKKDNLNNNRKSNYMNNQKTLNTAISPNFQHIINGNNPILNINEPMFNYDDVSPTHEIIQSIVVLITLYLNLTHSTFPNIDRIKHFWSLII